MLTKRLNIPPKNIESGFKSITVKNREINWLHKKGLPIKSKSQKDKTRVVWRREITCIKNEWTKKNLVRDK